MLNTLYTDAFKGVFDPAKYHLYPAAVPVLLANKVIKPVPQLVGDHETLGAALGTAFTVAVTELVGLEQPFAETVATLYVVELFNNGVV
jgi:hypothetical protein